MTPNLIVSPSRICKRLHVDLLRPVSLQTLHVCGIRSSNTGPWPSPRLSPDSMFCSGFHTVRNFQPQPRLHMLYSSITLISIDIYCVSMLNSSNNCDVGIDSPIFLLLPFPLSLVFAIAAAAS